MGFGFLAFPILAAPPNVVMIVSDDQGWRDYGFMGHEAIRTPALDKLASQSLVFTRGYVPTSLCRPSLATIMTGRYPHEHRITGNDPAPPAGQNAGKLRAARDPAYLAACEKMVDAYERSPNLPRLLGEAGYVSFQTGKWWEGDYKRGGFTAGMSRGDRHGDDGLKIGRQTMRPMYDFMENAVAEGKPFFLWYAPMLPHYPHDPPKRLLDKYTTPGRPEAIAKYYAMCEWFDETCGELLDYLDKKKLAENTLVVYIADNGWVQDTMPHPAFGGARGKRSPYDGGVRTPVMVRWPGHLAPKRDEQTLVNSIDLMPTVLAACRSAPSSRPRGGLAPQKLPGLNLLDTQALSNRDAVFGEVFTHDVADLDNPAASLRFRWCIEGRWKLILPHAANEPEAKPELYDVLADPNESNNLFSQHPDAAKRLQEKLDRWWAVPR